MLTIAAGILIAVFVIAFLPYILGIAGLLIGLVFWAMVLFGLWAWLGLEALFVICVIAGIIWVGNNWDWNEKKTQSKFANQSQRQEDNNANEPANAAFVHVKLKDMNLIQFFWRLYRSIGHQDFFEYLKVNYSLVFGDEKRLARRKKLDQILGSAEQKHIRLQSEEFLQKKQRLESTAAAVIARQERIEKDLQQKISDTIESAEILLEKKLQAFTKEGVIQIHRDDQTLKVINSEGKTLAKMTVDPRNVFGSLYFVVSLASGSRFEVLAPASSGKAARQIHKAVRKEVL